jgi:hypothetical protein
MFAKPCKDIAEIGVARHDVNHHVRLTPAKAGRQKITAAPVFVGVVIRPIANHGWTLHTQLPARDTLKHRIQNQCVSSSGWVFNCGNEVGNRLCHGLDFVLGIGSFKHKMTLTQTPRT